MRSLLFVPADSAKKLDKANDQRRRCADHRSRGFGRASTARRARGKARAAFLKETDAAAQRPYLLRAGEQFADRPNRRRPRRRRAGAARRHHAAEGRRRRFRRPCRRQARGARGDRRPARRPRQDHRASRPRPRPPCSSPARYRRREHAAHRADLGRRGSFRRARRRSQPRCRRPILDPYRLARMLCLAGAAAAEVPAIDTVYVDFRDSDGFRRECEEARRDGFTGKMAIHPAQVPIINEVFTPTRGGDRARAEPSSSASPQIPAPA